MSGRSQVSPFLFNSADFILTTSTKSTISQARLDYITFFTQLGVENRAWKKI